MERSFQVVILLQSLTIFKSRGQHLQLALMHLVALAAAIYM